MAVKGRKLSGTMLFSLPTRYSRHHSVVHASRITRSDAHPPKASPVSRGHTLWRLTSLGLVCAALVEPSMHERNKKLKCTLGTVPLTVISPACHGVTTTALLILALRLHHALYSPLSKISCSEPSETADSALLPYLTLVLHNSPQLSYLEVARGARGLPLGLFHMSTWSDEIYPSIWYSPRGSFRMMWTQRVEFQLGASWPFIPAKKLTRSGLVWEGGRGGRGFWLPRRRKNIDRQPRRLPQHCARSCHNVAPPRPAMVRPPSF